MGRRFMWGPAVGGVVSGACLLLWLNTLPGSAEPLASTRSLDGVGPGTCVTRMDVLGRAPEEAVTGCASRHTGVVLERARLGLRGRYPGDEAVRGASATACATVWSEVGDRRSEFFDRVEVWPADDDGNDPYRVSFVWPGAAVWHADGSNDVVCLMVWSSSLPEDLPVRAPGTAR